MTGLSVFLAQTWDQEWCEQIGEIMKAVLQEPGESPRARALAQLEMMGYSEGYRTLLGVVALMDEDAGAYMAEADASETERVEWRGVHRGLHSAMALLLMTEKRLGPKQAAHLVSHHIVAMVGGESSLSA